MGELLEQVLIYYITTADAQKGNDTGCIYSYSLHCAMLPVAGLIIKFTAAVCRASVRGTSDYFLWCFLNSIRQAPLPGVGCRITMETSKRDQ